MPDDLPSPSPAKDSPFLNEGDFRRQLLRSTLGLAMALGLPMLVLVGLVIFLLHSAKWVDHSDQVMAHANEAERLLATMQSSFRGYRLANNEQYLAAFENARGTFNSEMDGLAVMVSDHPHQSAAIAQARADAGAWLAFVDSEIARVRTAQTQPRDAAFLLRGGPLFDEVMRRFKAFTETEEDLRLERSRRLEMVETALIVALAFGGLLGIPGLVLWVQGLLRGINRSYRSSLATAHSRTAELQVTLRSIGDAVVATDAEGKVTFLNPVAETLMGWLNAEARGKDLTAVFDIYNEQTGGPAENPVARVLRENKVVGLANHTVLRSRNGTELPIEDSAAPIRGDDGRVMGVILVFHDVSERHAAEKSLHESARRFQFLNELGDATRTLVDPEEIMKISTRLLGEHLRVSRCAYADVEAGGEHFTIRHDYTNGCASTVGAYRLPDFGPRAVGAMRSGDTFIVRDMDAERKPDEGGATFAAIGIKAIICCPLVKAGELRAMMAVHQTTPRAWTTDEIALVQEVTDRCWSTIERARSVAELRTATGRAEAGALAAAESAERFHLLAEVVSLQVWTARPDGALDFANQECAHYLGGDLERDILGHAWAQHVHPDDIGAALRSWKSSLASGERYEVEFRLQRTDGEYRWFLVRAEAMRDGANRIQKWFGTNTDIHDLKVARDAAERANRAKDAFLAALSHELRTPLTPVLMTAAYLREDLRLPADVREQLGMMERNIALEARLIDDLLDLTSIARGKLQLRAHPCDAHSLIGLAVEIVRNDALAKGLTIERDLAAQRSGLVADPSRFQQVVWNLLRNAVKFTPPGGRIVIRTRNEDAGMLRIEVADSGIGITPGALENIFLPFDQGNLDGDHRFGGLGLGLAIARAIVDLHGGTISARSAGAGQGTTFSVDLPGAIDPPHGASETGFSDLDGPRRISSSPAAAAEPRRSKASLRLLLVEDHRESREVLARLLSSLGHGVVAVGTVSQAREAAALEVFDLVVSDLGLPDGTGNELMESLRNIHGLRGIALTGYGMETDVARSLESGFIAHIVKPVNLEELARALKEFA